MDMYQKRKARKEKSVNNVEENTNNKMNINWVMLFYGNTIKNIDISRFL